MTEARGRKLEHPEGVSLTEAIVHDLNHVVLKRLKELESQVDTMALKRGFWAFMANQALGRILLPGPHSAFPLQKDEGAVTQAKKSPTLK